MSHHFVTVCVVCVLCAAHAPCSAHTDGQGSVLLGRDSRYDTQSYKRPDDSLRTLINSQIGSKEVVKIKDGINDVDRPRHRRKRHDESSHKHTKVDYFTKQIFQEYGNGDSMTTEGFERLLKKLGLEDVIGKLKEAEQKTGAAGETDCFFPLYSSHRHFISST